jgi:hypothetical protein
MYEAASTVIEAYGDADSLHSRRDLVEARLVRWALAELGDPPAAGVEAEP